MGHDIKAIARRTWEEIIPAADVEALKEVVAHDVVSHGRRPDEPEGFEGVKQSMLWLATVFADQRWEIQHVIGDGDMVAVHAIHHGRHVGNLMGIEPTGREVAYGYVHIVRFENGKGVEHWGYRDDLSLMRQLGALPGRPPTPGPVPVASAAS